MIHVPFNAKNKDGECASTNCTWKRRGNKTIANYYHTHQHSWVCVGCAQAINRAAVEIRRMSDKQFKKPCLPEEEVLIMVLTGELVLS